jgi:hypothetical protein
MKPEDKEDVIVAIRPCCNRVVLAVVNIPAVMSIKIRREIGECAAEGCRIEHWTAEAVRKADFGCKCKPQLNEDDPREER